jgi:hypothetical protein
VAKALVAKGNTRQAHQVASAACVVGQSTKVLGLVSSLEPSAVSVLTDLVIKGSKDVIEVTMHFHN